MEFLYRSNEIQVLENQQMIGRILWTPVSEGVVNVIQTYVMDSYRGQGIANILMEEFVKFLTERKWRCIASCSYVKMWFQRHLEYQHLTVTTPLEEQ